MKKKFEESKRKRDSIRDWEHILSHIIFATILLLLILSPILFLPFTYERLSITRVTLLRIVVFFAFTCWALKFIFYSHIKRSHLDLPVLFFLFSATLSTVFSIHIPGSLLGEHYRYQGLSTLILYAFLYFLVLQVGTERRTNLMLDIFVVVATLVSLYGFAQYLGFDFISWGKERWEANRSFSTLGNPVFLGGYLSLVLPIAISRIFLTKKVGLKLLFAASVLIITTTVFTTFSRGAWLAVFAGIIGFLILSTQQKKVRKEVPILIILFTLVLLFVFLAGSFQIKKNPDNVTFTERISSLSRFKEGSLGTRLLIWQSALKIIREKPFLGWGPDTFRLVYPQVSSLQEARAEGYLKLSDNAHSYPLQIATTQGGLGLWAFLFLIVAILWTARNLVHTDKVYFLRVSGLLLGISSYLVYLLSGIVSVEVGAIFWIIVGLLASNISSNKYTFVVYAKRKWINPLSYIIFIVSLVVLLIVVFLSSSLFLADIYLARANRYFKQGLVVESEDNYIKANRFNPWSDVYPRHLGRFYAAATVETNIQDYFHAGVMAYEGAKRRNPRSPDNYGFLGSLYLIGGQVFSEEYFKLAEEELERAIELYPYWADVHSDLGILYFKTGRYKRAIKKFKLVREIHPADTKALLYLGRSYRILGEKSSSLSYYNELLKREPLNEEARKAVGELIGK